MSIKPKTCRNKACAERFTPSKSLQSACCIGCAIIVGRDKIKADAAKVAKLDRAITKQKLDAIKPRSKWLAEAQAAFNAFIRQRDIDRPCISSGRPLTTQATGGGFDAGHYRSIGSAPHLRFDERNVHGQSKQDNRYLSGNAVDYRIGLIERIGLLRVVQLEDDNAYRKWSIDDLKNIKTEYQARLKSLQQNKTPASLERSEAFTNNTLDGS